MKNLKNKIFEIVHDIIVVLFILILIGGGIAMPICLAIANQEPLYLLLYVVVLFVWIIFFVGVKRR